MERPHAYKYITAAVLALLLAVSLGAVCCGAHHHLVTAAVLSISLAASLFDGVEGVSMIAWLSSRKMRRRERSGGRSEKV